MFTVYEGNANQQRTEEVPENLSPKRWLKLELERIREHWTDFCNVTSVHGVRYLAASDRPLIERLWWATVLITCLYYATIYASALWKRWLDSPIEHTSAITYENVIHIPLPAITFCNNMKSTSNEKTETLLFLCGLADFEENNNTIVDVEKMVETLIHYEEGGDLVLHCLGLINGGSDDMAPPFECNCKLHYQHHPQRNVDSSDCSKMFTMVITHYGICYSFNMLDVNEIFREGVISNYAPHNRQSDWDPDSGYRKDAELKDPDGSSEPFVDGPYPKRANGSPVINISSRPFFNGSYCRNEGPGFKMAIHSPHEMPVIGIREAEWFLVNDDNSVPKERSYSNFQYNFEYAIELDPERTWANDGLRIFQPHQRKCYFNDEKSLTLFKFYTKTNCENECLINRTIENCKCVDFYMPHFESTRICYTKVDVECILETMDWWWRRGKKFCNCYPYCSEIDYNALIFGKNMSNSDAREDQMQNISISIYNTDEFYMSRENKQSQWTIVDLVASCGGVFGLFCGMSLIGVVEFVYYATIRVISNIIRRRREERKIEV